MPAQRGRRGRYEAGPPPEHGTRARYQAGCRCPSCEFANAEYQRSRRDVPQRLQLSLLEHWAPDQDEDDEDDEQQSANG